MVSKNQIKLINSLQQKKYRRQHQLFIAEGFKVIDELLRSRFTLVNLYVTESIFNGVDQSKLHHICESEMKKITALNTPSNCLAIFETTAETEIIAQDLIIALDDIRDPGNLGTIIRLCDWFGVEQIVCSNETADIYNPKVVQATMGSIARVKINYCDLQDFLTNATLPVYGTFMDGENIYSNELPTEAILVMGNEANGISELTEALVHKRISIPRFSKTQLTESLNVATATAIILSEFRRSSGT